MSYPRRLVEVDLPIKRISAHARREKSIRHGHISTLHIWWARRPLAACRAVICAALWPDPVDPLCPQAFRDAASRIMTEFARKACGQGKIGTANLAATCSEESRQRWEVLSKPGQGLDTKDEAHLNILRFALLDFIADFANWDNSTVPEYLETARALTQAAHEALGGEPGTRPQVVDPFAGGGSIPLEALRVGADAFASDLNPVAVLLNRVVLEYIPKYGQLLADEVRKWGQWVKEQAEKELARFYPQDPDGATPIAYLWARTITCEGPGCGAEIPLIRATSLSEREPLAHFAVSCEGAKRVVVRVREGKQQRSSGTVRAGKATCPCCGYTTPASRVKAQMVSKLGGADSARLLAVLTQAGTVRRFREPTPADTSAVAAAQDRLVALLSAQPNAVPEEPINPLRPYKNTVGVCIVTRAGMSRFRDLYTARQLLTLIALQRKVRETVASCDNAPEFRSALCTVLHFVLDRVVTQNSALSRWNPIRSTIEGMFSKQALQIIWDFVESNPIGPGMANWDGSVEWVSRVLDHNLSLPTCGVAVKASAASCPLPDDAADFLFTDPPYFAAIPYADLSDVFHVWLNRGLHGEDGSLFAMPISEKAEELVVTNSSRGPAGEVKDAHFFMQGMTSALVRGKAITREKGVACVVFADASTAAWEAMLSSVIKGGWVVTASWPIDTERQGRTRALSSASLQSSIFMVCRPRVDSAIGDWRDVLSDLPKRIHEWMPRLASEGVVGADAIFACLGPALEIFSRYERVETAGGDRVPLGDVKGPDDQIIQRGYLSHVWEAVAKEALSMIFAGADASGFDPDARVTAMWFWTLSTGALPLATEGEDGDEEDTDDEETGKAPKVRGFVLEYDAARKIAQGLGAHLEQLTSVVEVKGDKARLLPVSERARHLFGKDEGRAPARRAKKAKQKTFAFDESEGDDGEEGNWGELNVPQVGETVLDRLHQAMILFAAGRGEALRRFLVEEGAGRDTRFWRLAQALSALYPPGTEEKRWVDGVLGRKKGLGF